MLENVVWLVAIKMLVNRNIKNQTSKETLETSRGGEDTDKDKRISVPMAIVSIPEASDFEVQENYYKLHILVTSSN